MRSISKWNTTVRKFKDVPPGIVAELSARGSHKFIGGRYEPLDPLAKWMMWSSTFLVAVLSVLLRGPGAFVYLVLGVPAAMFLAIMIARMGGREWDRVVGLLYVLAMLFVLFALPG